MRQNIHRERNGRLIVLDGCENAGLISRNRCVPWDDNAEHVALHGDTKGEGGNIKQQQVLSLLGGLASKNSSLHGSTVGNSLIGVDGFVELAVSKIFGYKGLNLGDTR
jgi:hypothetical protein